MTDFIVAVDTSRLDDKLKRVPRAIEAMVYRTVQRLAIDLQGYVKADKLSGQVLHVRTGTLRRSINQEVQQSGSVIKGIVGTNVKYARIHEYGFAGEMTVKEHLRRRKETILADIKQYGAEIGKLSGLRNIHSTGEMFTVRAHMRHVNLPERSFLRSALKDFEPKIIQQLKAAATGETLK